MAELNDNPPIPGIGSGILHPKMRNRFRVLFLQNGSDEPIDELYPLSSQALAIDVGAEDLNLSVEPRHRTGRVVVTLEDDITCSVMTALRYWQKRQTEGASFDLVHDCLDGNETVVERFRFSACMMEAVQHSTWRYDVPTGMRLQLETGRTWVREDYMNKLDPVVKAIAEGISLSFYGKNPEIPGTCQKLLQVGFQVYTHEIFPSK